MRAQVEQVVDGASLHVEVQLDTEDLVIAFLDAIRTDPALRREVEVYLLNRSPDCGRRHLATRTLAEAPEVQAAFRLALPLDEAWALVDAVDRACVKPDPCRHGDCTRLRVDAEHCDLHLDAA